MAVQLPRWLRRALVHPPRDFAPGEFERYAHALTQYSTQIGLLVFATAAILWWPVDLIVFQGDAVRNFATSRPISITIAISAFFAIWGLRSRPNTAYAAATITLVLLSLHNGFSRAALGSLDGPWFWFCYLVPFSGLLLAAPITTRIVTTALISGAFPLAYFGRRPDYLEHPAAASALSFLAFAAVIAILTGHLFFRLIRANYSHRSMLEERVAARTEALGKLATHLDESRESERRRLARDLHDDSSQLLSSMRIELGVLRQLHSDGANVDPSVDRIDELVEKSFVAYRRMISSLRPEALDAHGLASALRWMAETTAERSGIEIDVDAAAQLDGLPDDVSLVAFRAAQEALTNIARHASATQARISAKRADDRLHLNIEDDGRGFRPTEVSSGHLGLLILKERARAAGGIVRVTSSPDGGTRLAVELPISARESAETRS